MKDSSSNSSQQGKRKIIFLKHPLPESNDRNIKRVKTHNQPKPAKKDDKNTENFRFFRNLNNTFNKKNTTYFKNFEELRNSAVDKIRSYNFRKDLYAHQIDFLETITSKIIDNNLREGYIVSATGTGKTEMFIELIKALDLKTLILFPTTQLVDQTYNRLLKISDEDSIGKYYTNNHDNKKFITLSTYQSIENIGNKYNLIILDEGHRALTSRIVEIINILKKNSFVFAFTATPEFNTVRQKGGLHSLEELFPNGKIFEYNTTQAVEDQILSPAIILEAKINDDEILNSLKKLNKTEGKDFNQAKLDNALSVRRLYYFIADLYLKGKYIKNNIPFFKKSALIFCVSIENSNQIAATLNEVFDKHPYFLESKIKPAESIHSKMPKDDINKILLDHKNGKIAILCNPNILTEGYDNRNLELIIDLRPTRSKIRKTQTVGRALRKNQDNPNKVALIVDIIYPTINQLTSVEIFGNRSILGNIPKISGDVINISDSFSIPDHSEYELIQPEQNCHRLDSNASNNVDEKTYSDYHDLEIAQTAESKPDIPLLQDDDFKTEPLDMSYFEESNTDYWQQYILSPRSSANSFQDILKSEDSSSPSRFNN